MNKKSNKDIFKELFGHRLDEFLEPLFNNKIKINSDGYLSKEKSKSNPKIDYIMYESEFIKTVLIQYINGIDLNSISSYMGCSEDTVNDILDKYSPYL